MVKSICSILDEINNDRTVPKNIRAAIAKAKEDLCNDKMDITMKISSAISLLDEAANDQNVPMYTRTQIMTIVSKLETMNMKNNQK